MSNELFDKKIKDRLNSVNSPVNPNVWNNIEKQLVIPWYRDFWRRFGFPAYSVISTLFILYCLKEIFQNKEQLNLLNEKISTMQQVKVLPEIKTVVQKDTVYIQKTIYIVENANKQEVIRNRQKPVFVLNDVVKSDLVNPTIQTNTPKTESAVKTISETKIVSNQSLSTDSSSIIPISSKEVVSNTHLSKDNKVYEELDSIVKADFAKKEEVAELPKSTKKPFKWPQIDSRFGVASAVSLAGDVNLGPIFELFLRPNISFATGLAINKYPTIEYISDKQFNFYTGQNFIELYRSKIPEKYDALTEISVNTSVLELPVYINYYVPLKRNFDLKFTFGTHLDLKLYQNIRFETYNNGEEIYTEFNTLADKNSWHNMILGAGLQYKLKNVAFQLSPTYLYNYREVDYVKSGGAFRINGSVLLNIGNR